MILNENIGLAPVEKEDHGEVDQTYAAAIRDIEKAEKKKAEFTKIQAEPKHDEKPKNPKMVSGAKKMHLDESLFEDILDEKKEKTKEDILDDLYDELRKAKYLVNADPIGYRIGKRQPEGQIQLSRKDKSYEFIKDEKDLDDAKAIVDKYGFKYYVKSTLGIPSLYIDTESLEEEIYSTSGAAGKEMSFDIKDDGTIVIYDGDKIVKQSKTNPTYAKQVLKDLGFKEKEIIKEDINNLEKEFTIHYNREGFEYGGYGAVRVKASNEKEAKEKFLDEKPDKDIEITSVRPTENEDIRKGIRLLEDTEIVKESFEDFYAQFDIRPERKIKEVYAEISPEEFQLDKIHPTKTIADIWSEMQSGEDFYRIASEDGEGFDSAVREGIFEIISKAFKIPYDTVYLTWRNGGKLEESFEDEQKAAEERAREETIKKMVKEREEGSLGDRIEAAELEQELKEDYTDGTTIEDGGEITPDSIQPGPEAGLAAELTKLIKEE